MLSSSKEVTARLIRAKKNIKRKLAALKQSKLISEEQLKSKYKPITESLQNIISTSAIAATATKLEPKAEIKRDDDVDEEQMKKKEVIFQEPLPSQQQRKKKKPRGRTSLPLDEDDEFQMSISAPNTTEDEVFEAYTDPETTIPPTSQRDLEITEDSFLEYMEQFAPLPKHYIEGFIRDTENVYDHGHASVRHDPELDKFYLGSSELQFSSKSDNIVVGGREFKGTPGLYELIFKKNPINDTNEDQKNYREIVLMTNAARVNYDPKKQIAGNASDKYRKVIAPLIYDQSTSKSSRPAARSRASTWVSSSGQYGGRGLMNYNNKPIEYIFWDDPNELVDRLRLLLASENAGNDGHNNEINSIVEELREARIIV